MIRSFKGRFSEEIWIGKVGKGFPADLVRVAQRKLVMVADAAELKDLRSPPGNRLEALEGDRAGQHSIRINDRWRVCFVWRDGGVDDVEVVDYH